MSAAAGYASWVADLEAAFEEVARTALGFEHVPAAVHGAEAPRTFQGAYLGLVGPNGAIQIGIASHEDGCQALAKRLLGMDPSEPALAQPEVADAVCEIVNIVAGGFKARLRDRVSPLALGLPVFFHGAVQTTDHIAVAVAQLELGAVPTALVLVHPRQGEAR